MEDKPMRLQSPFTQEIKSEEFNKKEQLSALELARLNRARETKRKMDELFGMIKAERDRRDLLRKLTTIEVVELVNIPAQSLNITTTPKKEQNSINDSISKENISNENISKQNISKELKDKEKSIEKSDTEGF